MKRSKITLSLIALGIIIPATAIAGNVHVRTGNVQATTNSNGDVYVDTGRTSVSVPTRRRIWYPWRYWRTSWQSKCRQSSYQQTTQVRDSGGKVTHHSSTSSYCR
ncbi:conserved exported hypothetical protein [Hyella patelloides LEGE 07179]|uniref:Uncharacterized protein n=1 Tax=Hyella patelloides LEGE 07179 TaxID=945734 RepID=A0A563VPJ7_9CYAN|nr:hypothetical protein [Hyella patelloides]VEP13331.1 conserved exported hypothetical protein [Hyella patelloides LEGE 07179]